MNTHPAQHFEAPSTITAGTPLKTMLDAAAVRLIGASLIPAVPGFDPDRFQRAATAGLDDLELKPRAAHIAQAMRAQLPSDDAALARCLIASMGPELTRTEGNGLQVFFYLPHSTLIHDHLLDWDAGMAACNALTRRFSAEYAVRPFLIRDQQRTLAHLLALTADPNPHVRRWCSEGARPLLPWAERLPALVADPAPLLPILDALADDGERYVTRSVANTVGDIAKHHPTVAFAWCDRVLERPTGERRWIVRHALRHPAKQGVDRAIRLRRKAS